MAACQYALLILKHFGDNVYPIICPREYAVCCSLWQVHMADLLMTSLDSCEDVNVSAFAIRSF